MVFSILTELYNHCFIIREIFHHLKWLVAVKWLIKQSLHSSNSFSPTRWETQVQSLSWEGPLEKEMATHSSILAWKISWREEPGGLQSMGLQWVRHDWATNTYLLRPYSVTHSTLARLVCCAQGQLGCSEMSLWCHNTGILPSGTDLHSTLPMCQKTALVWETPWAACLLPLSEAVWLRLELKQSI